MEFANIIVNISHENLDKTFQYRIPDELKDKLSIGDYVCVPFGSSNREINGYVLELTDTAEYDINKLKYIKNIVSDSRFVESKLIQLAYYIKKTYGSTMIMALKTVLPIKKQIKEKEERIIELAIDDANAAGRLEEYVKKHQTARERLLKELIKEKCIDYRLVTGKLNISKATIDYMEQEAIIRINKRRIYRNMSGMSLEDNRIVLNDEQRRVADSIIENIDKGINRTYLLHGITGSGKTEVYMEIIDRVVNDNKQVIVLIPEIALTYQTVMRFYKRFGDRVSTLHSKLSDGEKYDQFERAKKGEISIMIGPRSALFTPFSDLGLIIIDEEHESSYKSDNMPKYHARDVAIELARLHGASVVLGSATPSLEAYYKAKNNTYELLTLSERAGEGELATVHVADLKQELKDGNKSMFSRQLRELMEDRLNKNEQIMIFLNRRGYAGSVSCRACGHVIKCPHCTVSLSLHGKNRLMCHYCGYETQMVAACPECGSSLIGTMRAGTEQIEQNVKKLFPYASVLRMDADTTRTKDGYEKILSAFANREADILIGTQMIVKGHDFPYVTLMGILIADMSLNANDYRAGERTFDLLTQAAGRAGRAGRRGEVVIQTYHPEHYSIRTAASQDYEAFYNEEIMYRSLMDYPPTGHMLAIMIEGIDENVTMEYADSLAECLKNAIIKSPVDNKLRLIGPAEATIYKLNDCLRRMIYVKARQIDALIDIKDTAELFIDNNKKNNIRITFDMDPVNGY